MSGFEIIGVTLAVFPIIITLLENYEEGFNKVEAWRRHRLEFTKLVNSLNREKIIFQQHIESLLRTINDSEFDVSTMMSDFKCDAWKDPHLTLKLKRKLSQDHELENYLAGIESIHTNLDKLAARLERCRPPLKNEGNEQSGFLLQKGFRRLQIALGKKRWTGQIVELGAQIDRLEKLLSNAETLETGRQTSDSTIPKVFREIRVQASSLHKAIVRGWNCHCRDEHCFHLMLSKSLPQLSDQEPASRVLCVAFPPRQPRPAQEGRTEGAESVLDEDEWYMTDTSLMSPPDWERARVAETERLTIPGDRSERASISASTVSDISSSTMWTLEPTPTTATKATAYSTVSSSPESRRPSSMEDKWKGQPSPQFQGQAPRPPPSHHPPAIGNLCRLFGNSKESSLGYLTDEEGSYHFLRLTSDLPVTTAECDSVVPLSALLNGEVTGGPDRPEPIKLPRLARMALALKLAYALPQLHPSPWLRNSWSKADIHFFRLKTGQVLTDSPFLLWEMVWDRGKQHGRGPEDSRNALLSLGILILELWFGESIESHAFWRGHYGPDGKESESTRLTAAISWQKRAAADGGSILHDTTHRCIWGNFGVTTLDFEDTRFVAAIYDGVIRPLESMLGLMWPSAAKAG